MIFFSTLSIKQFPFYSYLLLPFATSTSVSTASIPIDSTVLGILIFVKLVPLNAKSPITLIPSFNITEFKFLQLRNDDTYDAKNINEKIIINQSNIKTKIY